MQISEDAFQLYLFAAQHPHWMGYHNNARTRRAVQRLAQLGCIEVNRYEQFRFRKEQHGTLHR